MSQVLIKSKPDYKRFIEKPRGFGSKNILHISELFSDTLQGEGVSMGVPSTFLRLQACTLNCRWCDTTEVWRQGNPYTFQEVFELFQLNNVIERFRQGQHLVLTGGSPLLQQDALINFLDEFGAKYGFTPYIEIENECTITPLLAIDDYIDQWNNSPKTSNSGMKRPIRYKPELLKELSNKDNSWFKFVIEGEDDMEEVFEDFISPGLIYKNQVVLMPQAENQETLKLRENTVSKLAKEYNVRYCSRLQVQLWNETTGV